MREPGYYSTFNADILKADAKVTFLPYQYNFQTNICCKAGTYESTNRTCKPIPIARCKLYNDTDGCTECVLNDGSSETPITLANGQ